VLATDETLMFAQTGLERAEVRAGLDAKLKHLIDNPTLLFGDTVLSDARKLLDDAAAVPEAGPRLTEQIAQLGRLVDLAATPISVQLQSDEITNVTLYRIGVLGVFASKQIELRPGTYTVVGSGTGYRDVPTFTVRPGEDLPAIQRRLRRAHLAARNNSNDRDTGRNARGAIVTSRIEAGNT
jgi:hypothetical protein